MLVTGNLVEPLQAPRPCNGAPVQLFWVIHQNPKTDHHGTLERRAAELSACTGCIYTKSRLCLNAIGDDHCVADHVRFTGAPTAVGRPSLQVPVFSTISIAISHPGGPRLDRRLHAGG